MIIKTHINIICQRLLILMFLLFFTSLESSAQNVIEKYGQSKSDPINGGFFFYEDKYIEAPYILERRGLDIFINGHKVDFISEPYDWRIFDDPGDPPADVNLPSGLPWGGTQYYNEYWGLKYRYLRTNMDKGQADKQLLEIMRNVSGISGIKVNPDNSDQMIIDFSCGKTQIFNWFTEGPFGGLDKTDKFTPVPGNDEMIKRAEKKITLFKDLLKKNVAYFNINMGGSITMGAVPALEAVEILISQRNPEDRVKTLDLLDSKSFLREPWKSTFINMQITSQLAERYKRISKELGIQSRIKEALSIGRGTMDWASDPENIIGRDNIPLESYSTEDNSSSETNEMRTNKKPLNIEAVVNATSDGLNTEDNTVESVRSSNNNSLGILGKQKMWFLGLVGFLIVVGIAVILHIRKGSSIK